MSWELIRKRPCWKTYTTGVLAPPFSLCSLAALTWEVFLHQALPPCCFYPASKWPWTKCPKREANKLLLFKYGSFVPALESWLLQGGIIRQWVYLKVSTGKRHSQCHWQLGWKEKSKSVLPKEKWGQRHSQLYAGMTTLSPLFTGAAGTMEGGEFRVMKSMEDAWTWESGGPDSNPHLPTSSSCTGPASLFSK